MEVILYSWASKQLFKFFLEDNIINHTPAKFNAKLMPLHKIILFYTRQNFVTLGHDHTGYSSSSSSSSSSSNSSSSSSSSNSSSSGSGSGSGSSSSSK